MPFSTCSSVIASLTSWLFVLSLFSLFVYNSKFKLHFIIRSFPFLLNDASCALFCLTSFHIFRVYITEVFENFIWLMKFHKGGIFHKGFCWHLLQELFVNVCNITLVVYFRYKWRCYFHSIQFLEIYVSKPGMIFNFLRALLTATDTQLRIFNKHFCAQVSTFGWKVLRHLKFDV